MFVSTSMVPKETLILQASELASQIKQGKLSEKSELKDLRIVLLEIQAAKLGKELKEQIDVIRGKCDEIIRANPITSNIVNEMPDEVIEMILSHTIASQNATVSKQWARMTPYAQIRSINEKKIKLSAVFSSPGSALVWLSRNPACRLLTYASFEGYQNVKDVHVKLLTQLCPNLRYLDIYSCFRGEFSLGDLIQHFPEQAVNPLQHLKNVPFLEHLIIGGNFQIIPGSLDCLRFLPRLQTLNINGCGHLNADCLNLLQYVPNLTCLEIGSCRDFDPNGLENLKWVLNLRKLVIAGCTQFIDPLKNLIYVPNLEYLDVNWGCVRDDALENLMHTPNLRHLAIAQCEKLSRNALAELNYTPNLKKISLGGMSHLDFSLMPEKLMFLIKNLY